MFSWNGFLFKMKGGITYGGGPPSQPLVYGLIALTALLAAWTPAPPPVHAASGDPALGEKLRALGYVE